MSRHYYPGIMLAIGLVGSFAHADTHEEQAQKTVEAMPCRGTTVGALLEQESRTHSRRDLGWRFFPEGETLDIERSFRVSKSMEVRFRWKVDHASQVQAVTDAAKSLCQP